MSWRLPVAEPSKWALLHYILASPLMGLNSHLELGLLISFAIDLSFPRIEEHKRKEIPHDLSLVLILTGLHQVAISNHHLLQSYLSDHPRNALFSLFATMKTFNFQSIPAASVFSGVVLGAPTPMEPRKVAEYEALNAMLVVATPFELAVGVAIQFIADTSGLPGNIGDIANAMVAALDPDAPKEPWVYIYLSMSLAATGQLTTG
jgi:hypothetical protein